MYSYIHPLNKSNQSAKPGGSSLTDLALASKGETADGNENDIVMRRSMNEWEYSRDVIAIRQSNMSLQQDNTK